MGLWGGKVEAVQHGTWNNTRYKSWPFRAVARHWQKGLIGASATNCWSQCYGKWTGSNSCISLWNTYCQPVLWRSDYWAMLHRSAALLLQRFQHLGRQIQISPIHYTPYHVFGGLSFDHPFLIHFCCSLGSWDPFRLSPHWQKCNTKAFKTKQNHKRQTAVNSKLCIQ